MTRSRFTQAAITRLARGLKAAGFKSVQIEHRPTGEILARASEEGEDAASGETDWDKHFSAKDKQAAQGRH